MVAAKDEVFAKKRNYPNLLRHLHSIVDLYTNEGSVVSAFLQILLLAEVPEVRVHCLSSSFQSIPGNTI